MACSELEIPKGMRLVAWEFGLETEIVAKGYETLAYIDNKGIVPKSSDIILEFEDYKLRDAASRFAGQLREMGWKEVSIVEKQPNSATGGNCG